MVKEFFRRLSHNFCLYLLAIMNLIHAIEHRSFDWLLWVSLALVLLSVVLNLICVLKGDSADA